MSDYEPLAISVERMKEIRETLRRDVICPMSEVKGGAHRYGLAGFCLVCKHEIHQNYISVAIDLLMEVDMLRSELYDR